MQRSLLTQYHVADASDFYNGADFWKVPNDPTLAATKTLNGGTSGGSSPTLPSTYMSLSPTGDTPAQWALSSPMVTLNYRQLAGFLTRRRPTGAGLREVHAPRLPGRTVGRVAGPGPERHRVRQPDRRAR